MNITRDDVTLTTAGVTAATVVVAADPGLPAILVDVQLDELVKRLSLDPRRGKVGS